MKNPIVFFVALICILTIGAAEIPGQSFGEEAPAIDARCDEARAMSIAEAAQTADAGGDAIDCGKINSLTAASAPPLEIFYESDIPLPAKRTYYQTIELMKISWPEMISQHGDEFGSKLVLGLNRPYYRLKKDVRVMGSFDINLDNILFGLGNSIKLTLRYDVKKPSHQGGSRVKLVIDGMAFKVGMPLPASFK